MWEALGIHPSFISLVFPSPDLWPEDWLPNCTRFCTRSHTSCSVPLTSVVSGWYYLQARDKETPGSEVRRHDPPVFMGLESRCATSAVQARLHLVPLSLTSLNTHPTRTVNTSWLLPTRAGSPLLSLRDKQNPVLSDGEMGNLWEKAFG